MGGFFFFSRKFTKWMWVLYKELLFELSQSDEGYNARRKSMWKYVCEEDKKIL